MFVTKIQKPVSDLAQVHEEDSRIIEAVRMKGFAYAPAEKATIATLSDRGSILDAFERQQREDPNPGRRWRSYSRVSVDRASGKLAGLPQQAYFQSKPNNSDDGGKQRAFAPVPPKLLLGKTVSWLVKRNLRLASALLPDISEQEAVTAGVHFVSYRPDGDKASFSSPIWLHKDDERFVAVTIFSVSENLGGGENVLTPGGRAIEAIINMRASMDTLFLTQGGFHAVFPMYSKDGRPAHRDVILTTFD